jgi:thymidylate synthase ThyX
MWHTVITSATEWQNFFNLRTHKDAQPEIQKIAVMMKTSYDESIPKALLPGEWHLPLIDWDDVVELDQDTIPEISAGKCARVSYLTHDGKRDPAADLELCRRLVDSGHMSPMEHAAMALGNSDSCGNFTGFKQYRKFIPNEAVYQPKP